MIFWNFDPELNNGVAARHFATLDQVFALEGELITHDPVSRLIRIEREGRRYYVKCYAGSGKKRSWLGLRQLLVPPRIRSEWQNLLAFAQWGIPTARLAAYGIERRWGAFRRGALITEEIRNTTDMAQLVSENDPRLLIPACVTDTGLIAYRHSSQTLPAACIPLGLRTMTLNGVTCWSVMMSFPGFF